jgi:hypothetical protein
MYDTSVVNRIRTPEGLLPFPSYGAEDFFSHSCGLYDCCALMHSTKDLESRLLSARQPRVMSSCKLANGVDIGRYPMWVGVFTRSDLSSIMTEVR